MTDDNINATLDTVIISTTRMKELVDFYQQGLQLGTPMSHGNNHLGFRLSGIYLGFDKIEEERQHNGAISLWFRVDNIEATFERLTELGARVKYPPTKKPWGDILAATFDPDGNTIGLAQR